MPAASLDRPEWKVPCKATRKNGDPCKKWAIRGGEVCEMHGGSAPQVREAAERRIEEARGQVVNLLPEAVVRLREMLRSPHHGVAIRAIKEVFDRSGIAVTTQHAVSVEAAAFVPSVDDEIERLLAGSGWEGQTD
jgi:hypothetical protein